MEGRIPAVSGGRGVARAHVARSDQQVDPGSGEEEGQRGSRLTCAEGHNPARERINNRREIKIRGLIDLYEEKAVTCFGGSARANP